MTDNSLKLFIHRKLNLKRNLVMLCLWFVTLSFLNHNHNIQVPNWRFVMKKKKIDDLKLTSKQSSEVINTMFSRLSAVERNRILNMIDYFIINELGISEEKLPWLNPNKKNINDFCHVLDLMRLSYAKLFNESEKNFKSKIH